MTSLTGHMMLLGDYTFSISTAAYTELVRSSEYRWKEIERVGRGPAMQFMGPGAESIKLTGVIFPAFNPGAGVQGALTRGIGMGQLNQMRSQADRGDPLMLVTGRGEVLGHYCVTGIEEGQTTFMVDGGARKQTFELSLKKYGDDQPGGLGILRSGISLLGGFLDAVGLGSVADAVFDAADAVTSLLDYGLGGTAANIIANLVPDVPSLVALPLDALGVVSDALVNQIGVTPETVGKPADWLTIVASDTGNAIADVASAVGSLGNVFATRTEMLTDTAFAVATSAYTYGQTNGIDQGTVSDAFTYMVDMLDDGDFATRCTAAGIDLSEQVAIAPPGANRIDIYWTQLVMLARMNPAALAQVVTNPAALTMVQAFANNFSTYVARQRDYYGHLLYV